MIPRFATLWAGREEKKSGKEDEATETERKEMNGLIHLSFRTSFPIIATRSDEAITKSYLQRLSSTVVNVKQV